MDRGLLRAIGRLLARALTDRKAAEELIHEVADDLAVATRTVSDVARAIAEGVPVSRALIDGGAALAAVIPDPVEGCSPSTSRRCASGVRACSNAPVTCGATRSRTRRTSGSSTTSPPTRPGSSCTCSAPARSPRWTSAPVGRSGWSAPRLVASGLTMIGARAGVRYGDEVPAYLNNLFRLGLVWFSSEQVEDPMDYQVLEAQPDVLEAMHSVRFAKLVRRSIHLTPFGINLCPTCLVDPERVTDLPEHGAPLD